MLIKRNPTPGLLAASRANGALSRGAVTAAGQAAAAHAGLRHGLCSAAAVLPTESHPDFVAFLADLRPRTPRESALTEQIVSALWCLQRARVAESDILTACVRELFPGVVNYTHHHLSAAFSHLAAGSGILDLIGRFESRHERRFHRALRRLGQLREARVIDNLKIEVPPVNALKTIPANQHWAPLTQATQAPISVVLPAAAG